jgi:hypothetical protein
LRIGKGFKCALVEQLAGADPAAPPRYVDRPPPDDRGQPRLDRPARLVSVAYPVQRQQRVLDCILDLLIGAEMAPGDRPSEGQDRVEEGAIGLCVAGLRGGEQRAPFRRASVAGRIQGGSDPVGNRPCRKRSAALANRSG